MKEMILLTICSALACGQTTMNGGRIIRGSWDASGAASTRPVKVSASDPASCMVGELLYRSDTGKLRQCSASGTWSDVSSSSAGGGYSTIQDEGTALPQETIVNLVGRGLMAEDSAGKTNLYLLDPRRYVYEWDEFVTQGSSSSGVIGKLGWGLILSSTLQTAASSVNHPGVASWLTNPNTTSGLFLGNFNNKGIDMSNFSSMLIIYKHNADTDYTHIRLGLADAYSSSLANGIYFENSGADTAWWGTVMNASAKTRTSSPLANTDTGNYLVFYVEKLGSNQVRFKVAASVDAALDTTTGAQTITTALPSGGMYVVLMTTVDTGGATMYSNVDFVDLLLTVTR